MPKVIFKLTLMLFTVVLLCMGTVYAGSKKITPSDVTSVNFYLGNEKSEYPIVRTADFDASYKINKDIELYLADMRAAFDSSDDVTSSFSYKLHYEDSQTLSLTFNEYRYHDHAAHGSYYIHGAVYDKTTGEQVPLEHYLVFTPQQLQESIDNNTAKIYGGDGTASLSADEISKITYIPADYYLLKRPDGMYIGLLYPPYELAPWAAGIIHIVLPMPKG
ncbi:RsiV family protein [Pectinatus haikarae]|uniref:RsiV family protein n=1 Tax=Pectinatus haikarae TaxID=349096 RepID=UPI0018C49A3D|nr:RsiV family protein [Pectinatus haikarae]